MAKKNKKSNGAKRFRSKYTDDQTIKLMVTENPKREGSAAHEAFKVMKNGMTIGAYRAAIAKKFGDGVAGPELHHNVKHGFIKIV